MRVGVAVWEQRGIRFYVFEIQSKYSKIMYKLKL